MGGGRPLPAALRGGCAVQEASTSSLESAAADHEAAAACSLQAGPGSAAVSRMEESATAAADPAGAIGETEPGTPALAPGAPSDALLMMTAVAEGIQREADLIVSPWPCAAAAQHHRQHQLWSKSAHCSLPPLPSAGEDGGGDSAGRAPRPAGQLCHAAQLQALLAGAGGAGRDGGGGG